MATCLVCGKSFEPRSTVQKYCSQDCHDEARRRQNREFYRAHSTFKSEVRSCVICGKKFLTRNDKQICCSSDCRKVYNNEYLKHKKYPEPLRRAHDEPSVLATCPVCGNNFAKSFHTQKFCPDCRNKLNTARGNASMLALKCERCGKKFVPLNANQRFCCKSCSETFRATRRSEPKPAKTLEQWQAEAAACGLSYGYYRAALASGKSFEELKLS